MVNSRLEILLALFVVLGPGLAVAQPPSGSQLPDDENGCALCHGEARLWTGPQQHLFVPRASLAEDVHRLKGVNCHDCHGGNPATLDVPLAHAPEVASGSGLMPFRQTPEVTRQACAVCHQEAALLVRKSVHARAERASDTVPGEVLLCNRCHGAAHGLLAAADPRSPVCLDHQVATCGACHEGDLESYTITAHGRSLFQSGLIKAAVCADCHGAHGIYYAADERSTLHLLQVAETCGKCHQGIGDMIERSVHGGHKGLGQPGQEETSQKKWGRMPTCTDCHQGHRLFQTDSADFSSQVVNFCGNCHPDLTGRYAMSTHGELTELGYVAAAQCPDCHGSHGILPISDPQSRLAAGENRLDTCRQCHTHAVANFSRFDPHADHKNAEKYPALYGVYSVTHTLFYAFMAFFVIHGSLWFLRSFIIVLRQGRHRTLVAGRHVIQRFTPANRLIYVTLLVALLGLTATGLPLKYSSQQWARVYVRTLGGFEYTSFLHHIFGFLALGCCAAHVVFVIVSLLGQRRRQVPWPRLLWGPDSPAPSVRDARDLLGMVRWFFGMGPKPTFDRWTYWEKYDYWMAVVACLLVGTSGLIMMFPNAFCRVISGESLNLARMFHVELALLASSFLFVFHFFHTHFRPEKFPLDLSSVTGLVSEQHLRAQRPDYVARLEQSGQLASMQRPAPTRHRLWLIFLASAVIFLIGIGLLAVALTAAIGK